MNIIKYIMMAMIIFAPYNIYSSETPCKKNPSKVHLTKEQQALLSKKDKEGFQNFNDAVSEAALTITDATQRAEFLKKAYSEEINIYLREDTQKTKDAYIVAWQITGDKLSAHQRSPQKGHPSSPRNISNKSNRRMSATSTNTLLPAKRKLEY